MDKELQLLTILPNATLSDFVELFFMFANHSDNELDISSLPDGRIDVVYFNSETFPYKTMLSELDIQSFPIQFPAKSIAFGVRLKLLALEYILHNSIADQQTKPLHLPDNFWGITIQEHDFESFVKEVSKKMEGILITKKIDERKRLLFENIYSSNGAMTVKELSEKSFWTSRGINRYFNKYIGLSLKAYCNILRFNATLPQIKAGNFLPDQNFSDQSHFIKNIKKYSGVTPTELHRNENDRFILLSDKLKN